VEQRDLKGQVEQRDLKGQVEHKDHKGQVEQRDLKGQVEHKARPVPKDHKDQVEKRDHKDQVVLKDHKDLKVLLVILGHKDQVAQVAQVEMLLLVVYSLALLQSQDLMKRFIIGVIWLLALILQMFQVAPFIK
jgi:hypothetical protein